jgi:hypothetical protein
VAALCAAQGFQYTRPVVVPAAGWVRVPLDLAALRRLGTGRGLRLTGPSGEPVELRVEPYPAAGERRAVTVQEVKPDGPGWALRLDLGPSPPPHQRLVFELARLAAAPAVGLEASDDGKSWEPLAAGDLVHLGEESGLQLSALPYPATTARYLRVAWPRAAGFPQVRGVAVETVSGRALSVTSRAVSCRPGAGTPRDSRATVCRLPLPAPGQVVRRLTVELAARGAVGFRLYAPARALWRRLAQGTWREDMRTRAVRHVILLASEPLNADALRLELYGSTSQPPTLLAHSFDLVVETVLFRAGEPGTYSLSYGGLAAPRPSAAGGGPPAPLEDEMVEWIAPGAEQEAPLPPLPAAAVAPAAPLSRERFRASWAVAAPGAAPGDLVRLGLPDEVYFQARTDLGDLRLASAGDRQVPYVRWTPEEPVEVLAREDLHPQAEKGRHYSRIDVALPGAGLPLTLLDLSASAVPLLRPLGVRYPASGPSGLAPPGERVVARQTWECIPEPPLPCATALTLGGPAPRRLALRFADGDNPPLGSVGLSLWRRGDVLLFAWPRQGPVHLLAGDDSLNAPVYDLATLAETLPGRPWQPAVLSFKSDEEGPSPWWNRWVLPATLAAAGLFLLLLLRRILSAA